MDPTPAVGVPDMEPREDIVGKSPTVLLIEGRTAPVPSKIFTPTAIEAFGRMAQNRYADANISPTAQLFKRFKMVRAAAAESSRRERGKEGECGRYRRLQKERYKLPGQC